MEIRKIQTTGGSSFIVTLPKGWIVANNLKKNDPVEIDEQGDGSLVVMCPGAIRNGSLGIRRICADDIDGQEFLFRVLLGSYVSGFRTIELYSNGSIASGAVDVAERFVQSAIGLEIIESSERSITMKDLADPAEMKLSRSISRMESLVRSMLADVFSAIVSDDTDKMSAVISRDKEVDRLEWMISRQTNLFQNDPSVARKMGHTQSEATMFYTLCRIIERIGDHAVSISQNVSALIAGKVLGDKMRTAVTTMGDTIQGTYRRSLDLLSVNDIAAANACIDDSVKMSKECEELNSFVSELTGDCAVSASLIFGSMRRMAAYCTDIAELAINRMMGIGGSDEADQ
jgi:phosphate uptake regulator